MSDGKATVSEALGNMDYIFSSIAYRSTQARSVAIDRVLSIGQIEQFVQKKLTYVYPNY